MLSPFAPHIAEELWHQLGNSDSICVQKWPRYDPQLVKADEIEIPIQINGKLRDKITVAAELSDDQIKELALKTEKVRAWVSGKEIIKVIFVPKKLVNIVIR